MRTSRWTTSSSSRSGAQRASRPRSFKEILTMATTVVMDTSLGALTIELDDEKAPITVQNFLGYVDDKFYDNTIFHRVISNFMIQGGGFEPGMKQKKTKASIKNESGNGLTNARGTLAM